MKIQLVLCLLVVAFPVAQAQAVYSPPPASAAAVQRIDFAAGRPIGARFRARFLECDSRSTCDSKPLKFNCRLDPSRNTALLSLANGTIFFDGKMGLDADGSPIAKLNATGTDQPETSFRFSVPGKPSVDADKIPFIVLPGGGFAQELGLEQGDLAAVVFNGKLVFAMVADAGPTCKIGEGSIQLHEELGHKVCRARNGRQECTKLRNVGIEKDVLYFVFPGSKIAGLTPANAKQRIAEEGARRFNALLGAP